MHWKAKVFGGVCTQACGTSRSQQCSWLKRNTLPLSHMGHTHIHILSASCSGCCFYRTKQTILYEPHLPYPILFLFSLSLLTLLSMVALYFGVRKPRDRTSTYLDISDSVHLTATFQSQAANVEQTFA